MDRLPRSQARHIGVPLRRRRGLVPGRAALNLEYPPQLSLGRRRSEYCAALSGTMPRREMHRALVFLGAGRDSANLAGQCGDIRPWLGMAAMYMSL